MKKTFVMIAAVLAAIQTALPEADAEGKYPVEEPVLDALEKALADAKTAQDGKDQEIKDLKAQLTAKEGELATAQARITELEALPAGKNHEVIEAGEQKIHNEEKSPMEQLQETFANARKMMAEV